MGDGHLRLDPGLPPYLLGEQGDVEADAPPLPLGRRRRPTDPIPVPGTVPGCPSSPARLTLLELPNILAVLAWLQETALPEKVVDGGD